MNKEDWYILCRKIKASIQSLWFYFFRILPIDNKKIVFTCIEGTTGYTCNPKYIAEELINRNDDYKLIWLVNDISKTFPKEIKVVHNTLLNRAYQLTTAKIWIDNSRKQLEARKRKGQIYIQTWHAKLGFKPTCLDRGKSFSKIAYLVSKHDSDMIDYVLSNSEWYDKTLPTGMLYNGKILRTGSPRCDILVNRTAKDMKRVRDEFNLPIESKIIMYAPTFRGGSQGIDRAVEQGDHIPDLQKIRDALAERFGGSWVVFLRLHPQLVARHQLCGELSDSIIDVSEVDDMYEILAGCDAFLTDYSSAAFDAMVMKIPVFLYCDDYAEYQKDRGSLLWKLEELPFPMGQTQEELIKKIKGFDSVDYKKEIDKLCTETEMIEDGKACDRVINCVERLTRLI